MLDSEVLLGRTDSIPNPGVAEPCCSGRISPNKRPFWRCGVDCAVDLDDFAVAEPDGRGLAILLAKD